MRRRPATTAVLSVLLTALVSTHPSAQQSVSAADLQRWMKELSNWGRWGPDDQLGALNLITPEKRRQAAALIRAGTTVSLSRQATTVTASATGQTNNAWQRDFMINANGAAVERLSAAVHGTWQTHLDGLCHFFYEGRSFNGYSVQETAATETGCTKLDIDTLTDGIVSRGVLLDIPRSKGVAYLEAGYAVTREDIETWEKQAGITVSAGDVVMLHTGRALRPAGGRGAGFHPNVIPWLKARDVAVLGSDGGQEVMTVDGFPFYIHLPSIVALGVPIVCGADLQAAAELAARLNRWEFMFVAATLRIPGISSSPFNPIAIF